METVQDSLKGREIRVSALSKHARFSISRFCSVFGECNFKGFAPSSCSELHNHLKLDYQIIMGDYGARIKDYFTTESCTCPATVKNW